MGMAQPAILQIITVMSPCRLTSIWPRSLPIIWLWHEESWFRISARDDEWWIVTIVVRNRQAPGLNTECFKVCQSNQGDLTVGKASCGFLIFLFLSLIHEIWLLLSAWEGVWVLVSLRHSFLPLVKFTEGHWRLTRQELRYASHHDEEIAIWGRCYVMMTIPRNRPCLAARWLIGRSWKSLHLSFKMAF